MLTLLKVSNADDAMLSQIKPLYESAFPISERRTWPALLPLLHDGNMHLNAIINNHSFVGLAIYWHLQEWLYLEHLAIEPHLRGLGHGRKVIEALKKTGSGKLILETELPETEEARRRVAFYESCGIQAVPYPYNQPPYRKNEASFALMLMSTFPLLPAEYESTRDLIRQQVYEKFH